jgi:hypothetical protein
MTVTIRGISGIRKFVIFPVSKPLALNAQDSTIRLGDTSLSSAVVLVTIHYELPYQRITKSNAYGVGLGRVRSDSRITRRRVDI